MGNSCSFCNGGGDDDVVAFEPNAHSTDRPAISESTLFVQRNQQQSPKSATAAQAASATATYGNNQSTLNHKQQQQQQQIHNRLQPNQPQQRKLTIIEERSSQQLTTHNEHTHYSNDNDHTTNSRIENSSDDHGQNNSSDNEAAAIEAEALRDQQHQQDVDNIDAAAAITAAATAAATAIASASGTASVRSSRNSYTNKKYAVIITSPSPFDASLLLPASGHSNISSSNHSTSTVNTPTASTDDNSLIPFTASAATATTATDIIINSSDHQQTPILSDGTIRLRRMSRSRSQYSIGSSDCTHDNISNNTSAEFVPSDFSHVISSGAGSNSNGSMNNNNSTLLPVLPVELSHLGKGSLMHKRAHSTQSNSNKPNNYDSNDNNCITIKHSSSTVDLNNNFNSSGNRSSTFFNNSDGTRSLITSPYLARVRSMSITYQQQQQLHLQQRYHKKQQQQLQQPQSTGLTIDTAMDNNSINIASDRRQSSSLCDCSCHLNNHNPDLSNSSHNRSHDGGVCCELCAIVVVTSVMQHNDGVSSIRIVTSTSRLQSQASTPHYNNSHVNSSSNIDNRCYTFKNISRTPQHQKQSLLLHPSLRNKSLHNRSHSAQLDTTVVSQTETTPAAAASVDAALDIIVDLNEQLQLCTSMLRTAAAIGSDELQLSSLRLLVKTLSSVTRVDASVDAVADASNDGTQEYKDAAAIVLVTLQRQLTSIYSSSNSQHRSYSIPVLENNHFTAAIMALMSMCAAATAAIAETSTAALLLAVLLQQPLLQLMIYRHSAAAATAEAETESTIAHTQLLLTAVEVAHDLTSGCSSKRSGSSRSSSRIDSNRKCGMLILSVIKQAAVFEKLMTLLLQQQQLQQQQQQSEEQLLELTHQVLPTEISTGIRSCSYSADICSDSINISSYNGSYDHSSKNVNSSGDSSNRHSHHSYSGQNSDCNSNNYNHSSNGDSNHNTQLHDNDDDNSGYNSSDSIHSDNRRLSPRVKSINTSNGNNSNEHYHNNTNDVNNSVVQLWSDSDDDDAQQLAIAAVTAAVADINSSTHHIINNTHSHLNHNLSTHSTHSNIHNSSHSSIGDSSKRSSGNSLDKNSSFQIPILFGLQLLQPQSCNNSSDRDSSSDNHQNSDTSLQLLHDVRLELLLMILLTPPTLCCACKQQQLQQSQQQLLPHEAVYSSLNLSYLHVNLNSNSNINQRLSALSVLQQHVNCNFFSDRISNPGAKRLLRLLCTSSAGNSHCLDAAAYTLGSQIARNVYTAKIAAKSAAASPAENGSFTAAVAASVVVKKINVAMEDEAVVTLMRVFAEVSNMAGLLQLQEQPFVELLDFGYVQNSSDGCNSSNDLINCSNRMSQSFSSDSLSDSKNSLRHSYFSYWIVTRSCTTSLKQFLNNITSSHRNSDHCRSSDSSHNDDNCSSTSLLLLLLLYRQILSSLLLLHEQHNIVHFDVKADNVVLDISNDCSSSDSSIGSNNSYSFEHLLLQGSVSIKLADFGDSLRMDATSAAATTAATAMPTTVAATTDNAAAVSIREATTSFTAETTATAEAAQLYAHSGSNRSSKCATISKRSSHNNSFSSSSNSSSKSSLPPLTRVASSAAAVTVTQHGLVSDEEAQQQLLLMRSRGTEAVQAPEMLLSLRRRSSADVHYHYLQAQHSYKQMQQQQQQQLQQQQPLQQNQQLQQPQGRRFSLSGGDSHSTRYSNSSSSSSNHNDYYHANRHDHGYSCDVWSVALLLYEMLSNNFLFHNNQRNSMPIVLQVCSNSSSSGDERSERAAVVNSESRALLFKLWVSRSISGSSSSNNIASTEAIATAAAAIPLLLQWFDTVLVRDRHQRPSLREAMQLFDECLLAIYSNNSIGASDSNSDNCGSEDMALIAALNTTDDDDISDNDRSVPFVGVYQHEQQLSSSSNGSSNAKLWQWARNYAQKRTPGAEQQHRHLQQQQEECFTVHSSDDAMETVTS